MLKGEKYLQTLCIMDIMCVKLPSAFCMALASIIGYWQLGNTTRKTEWRLALTRTPSVSLAELLCFDDINKIVKFLQQFAEQHAILLPGRVPNHKRDDVKLLPSSNSKKVSDIIVYLYHAQHPTVIFCIGKFIKHEIID